MYTNRATASDGLLFDISDDAAANARGAMDAMAAVAPRSGRNSRRVRPAVCDFRSCLEFSDEAMMPPCKQSLGFSRRTAFARAARERGKAVRKDVVSASAFAVDSIQRTDQSESNLGRT